MLQNVGEEIAFEDIEMISRYPNAKSIIISGLSQETFDYFINNYGSQFEAITFWKFSLYLRIK